MSGKQSKKVRKEKRISKKVVAGAAAAIIGSAPVIAEGGEFLISVFPHFSFPIVKFDDSLSTGFGGGLQLTYRPNQYFNIFLQGDYKVYTFDTKQDIGNLNLMGATVGGGYHLPVTDRLGIDFNAGIGYYHSEFTHGAGANKTKTALQGLSVSGGIFVSYKINPTISVFAGGGANHYAYKNSKFITSADVTPGVTFNLTKAFSNKTNISVNQDELKPVFPVFYSWYNDNPFGSVEITNNEDVTITDVNVYFFQPQYMSQPKECGKMAKLKQGESFSVDLRAFFNEQMLELNEKNDTMSTITVEYKYLGKKSTATFPMVVPVYGRNNMSWEDDRCASAFVSSKDPAAMWFAKYVVSTIRDNIRSGLTTNIQYAMGIFDALDQFGINYVKDPTSAFEDNVGTASIDFLQFPYQTLMYRGGDCDDLSILVCSLLESVGIKTAFITIPGHIFMAFDSGFTVEEAKEYFLTLDEFIVDGNKVWVPLEITLTDEGFNKAWHKGAWEWNTAARNGAAALYKMEDSWKIYKPVNVPGAVARFTLPEETYVARLFSHSVDEFIIGQIMPQIAYYENRIAMNPSAQNYNDFGVLYARYGLFGQAEKQFRLARSLEYLPSVLNTANLYYSIKDYERATNWYKEVLNADAGNLLAMIGLARCAYEEGNYKECDRWYGTVFNKDIELARKYSYLGAFESTAGRSFSLADRLEKTIWVSGTEVTKNDVVKPLIQPEVEPETDSVTNAVVEADLPEPVSEDVETLNTVVAVVPSSVKEESEKSELEEDKYEGGDDDGDGEGGNDVEEYIVEANSDLDAESAVAEAQSEVADTQSVVAEAQSEVSDTESAVAETQVESEPETYVGISSQLDINFISVEELVALAADTVKEHGETIDDITIPVDDTVDFERYVEEQQAEASTAITQSAVAEAASEVSDADLRVKPEDDTKSREDDTKSPEDDATQNVIPVLDTGISDGKTIADLRDKPEDDTMSTEDDTKSPEEDTQIVAADTADEENLEPLPTNPASSTTSVTTDVPLRAVPRFTVQPSAEWAPESAYTAETIPGMKPFEEEMGNYQNEKAFLYKENEFDFAVNPGEEIKEEKKEDTTELASLKVNPFSSFLSEKEAAKVEAITNFKIEEVVKPVEKAVVTQGQSGADLRVKPEDDTKSPEEDTTQGVIPVLDTGIYKGQSGADLRVKPEDDNKLREDDTTQGVIPVLDTGISQGQSSGKSPEDDKTQSAVVEALETTTVTSNDIPVPEVVPQPEIATTEETAVAVPHVEKGDVSTSADTASKKSNGILLAAIAGGLAAAISGVYLSKKRKGK